MRNTPPYVLDSVDKALQLLQLLSDLGKVRVSEAAASLEIGRSTAHRLLATLTYRGFAEQDADRAYRPGPSFARLSPIGNDLQRLRRLALPAMEDRSCPTVALTSFCRERGARVFRVHEVKPNVEALRMTEAILGE